MMKLTKKEFKIITLLVIDTVFFFLEITIGYAVNSLALIADSFHMLNDIISLVVALWAVNVAKNRAADAKYTYGWLRAEILGALINAVFLLALCFTIFIEAIQRLLDPPNISNPKLILIVGTFGLISNVVGLFLFHEHGHSHGVGGSSDSGHSHSHFGLTDEEANLLVNGAEDHQNHEHEHEHEHVHGQEHDHSEGESTESSPLFDEDIQTVLPSYVVQQLNQNNEIHNNHNHKKKKASHNGKSLNMHGVFLHVLGDALGNIGVMLTAFFIWKTEYSWRFYSDPVISLVITCIIFSSALPLCKSSSRILLQGTPTTVNTDDVISDIIELPGVISVHDFHIWNLTEKLLIASLHVELDCAPESFLTVASSIKSCLHDYGVHSATIQPEFSAYYSRVHQLPRGFSSSQNLLQDSLTSSSRNPAAVNGRSQSQNNVAAPNTANTSHDNGPVDSADVFASTSRNASKQCLVDACAGCTTFDCIN